MRLYAKLVPMCYGCMYLVLDNHAVLTHYDAFKLPRLYIGTYLLYSYIKLVSRKFT